MRKLAVVPDLTSAHLHEWQLLAELERSSLAGDCHLAGGTALSGFYLAHRESADLDLLSDAEIPLTGEPRPQPLTPDSHARKSALYFDPKTNMVSRNGKVLTFARFERVIFYFQAPQFQNVAEKRYGNYVTLRVTCAPDVTIEANRNRPDAERITKSVVTLITSIGIQQKASQELFPLWNRNQEPTVAVE
ncbi:MAG: nucleotidyl transferase AbiEii/AbiGii toxin family protein [Candidatus Riflebacteria bacterium]|nr:nucleotidyl transferase AbiEii/AbiGii toxin family protein [Candidatus Riflebacteria bacterium]